MIGDANMRRGGRGRGGFTLLEVMMAVSVLGIATFGLLASFNSAVRLREVVEQEVFATDAMRQKLDEIRADAALDFDATIADCTSNTEYKYFPVRGIDRADPNDADHWEPAAGMGHLAGEVVLWLDGSHVPEEFGLVATDATGRFGELALTDGAEAGEIKLLPVEVRVQWWRPGMDRNGGKPAKLRRFLLLARKN